MTLHKLAEKLDELKKLIVGNGHLGLTGKVAMHDKRFDDSEKRLDKIEKKSDNFGKWLVRICIAINSFAAVGYILYKLIKGVL